MEPLKLTPIDQIEDMADGVPVLAVEGTVKYAQDLKRSPDDAARPWTKQFFVLSSGTAEIACSMWDAEGNELSKGEKVHIENTQNKKGQWNGMVKGSYQKDGERKHTLEIRANQVKITSNISEQQHAINKMFPSSKLIDRGDSDPDWPEAAKQYPSTMTDDRPAWGGKTNNGVDEARKHLMQSSNLYNLCVSAVDKAIAPNMPNIAQTSEQFQAAVASLFIEASREVWWSGKIVKPSLIESMPTKPLQ